MDADLAAFNHAPGAAVTRATASQPDLFRWRGDAGDHAGGGGYLDLHWFRREQWNPAVRAAGLGHRTPYALRHTFASWSIAAGIGLFELARLMGTSVEQIDETYGHLLPDSLDRARAALEAFGYRTGTEAAAEEGGQ
jgi:integrase